MTKGEAKAKANQIAAGLIDSWMRSIGNPQDKANQAKFAPGETAHQAQKVWDALGELLMKLKG